MIKSLASIVLEIMCIDIVSYGLTTMNKYQNRVHRTIKQTEAKILRQWIDITEVDKSVCLENSGRFQNFWKVN